MLAARTNHLARAGRAVPDVVDRYHSAALKQPSITFLTARIPPSLPCKVPFSSLLYKLSTVPAKCMTYIKYPRTHHLPWSPGADASDQFMHDVSIFEGRRVVVTEKMDGENTTMYSDHIHARSINSCLGGEERAWVKQFWSTIAHDIPHNWRICGENLWAVHSIHYDDLLSYFYGFSVWNEQNICLSWDETLLYFELLGVVPVPVLYDGNWNAETVMALAGSMDFSIDEGYVVRLASSFPYCHFKDSVAKFVRKGHAQTTKQWRKEIIPNSLLK